MNTLTIELAAQEEQSQFNLRRYSELFGDSDLARELGRFERRVETDRHGQLIISPPPGLPHGRYQAEIAFKLNELLPHGRVVVECPISTADGVRAAEVVWISRERLARSGDKILLIDAPEICVEVLSPDNTRRQMAEKRALYFAAGAEEAWICDIEGKMTFFVGENSAGEQRSKRCPDFPAQITL